MEKQVTYQERSAFNTVYITVLIILALFLNLTLLHAQTTKIKVRGTVKDAYGEFVIGASVVEKGTSNGTITDLNGSFEMQVFPKAVLTVSYIGLATQEISIGDRTILNLTMKEDSKTLDEIVVVGFGTQKKVNLTGSVGVVSTEELESRPVLNATQALQGLVPGLQISTKTGEMDKNQNINIRGKGTIGEGSSDSPLILIDGMEGDINTVNPQDIENVTVLKDAAASSIYGSRAPFGVILITTKKGKTGKASVNYNNSFRISSPINMPQMMDSYTFANYFNEAAKNIGWGKVFADDVMQQMLDFQAAGKSSKGGLPTDGNVWGKPAGDPFTRAYANTDWYKEIYKDQNFSQEHNLSLSGGTDKITYYASLGYLNQKGLLRQGSDGLKRYNATAKINADLTSWASFNYTMRFVRTDNWRPTNFNNGLYEKIGRQTWPNLPIYDENGFYHNSNADTPAMQLALGGDRNVQTDKLYHQAAVVIEPLKNWRTHFEFNYSTNSADVRETNLPYYNHDVKGNIIDTKSTSSLYQDHLKENYLNLNIYSDYNYSINDKHNFKLMAGFQAEEMKQSFFSSKKYGLLINKLPEFDLAGNVDGTGKAKFPETNGYRNEWATAGFFGRLNYDYEGKYLAELNMRYDGTSRFRQGNRWQLYPSFSFGWNVARESFWESLSNTINTLKMRVSYGELGNQNTNEWYPTYRNMSVSAANGGWLQNSLKPNVANVGALISTQLTWETIRTWNIGIDWGAFRNRLTGSFDFYTRYTDNMVGPAPELPNVLGVDPAKSNNCDLKATGWELELSWNDRLRNNLGYGFKFMLSDAQTVIQKYPGNTTNSIWTYYSGKKAGEIWGFKTIGLAKSKEEMETHLKNVGGQPFGSEWGAGDVMYANLDGNVGVTEGSGTLNDHGDLKIIGNDTPRFHFAFELSADWKGFDFRAFFQGVMKRDYWQDSNIFWGVTDDQWWSAGLKEHGDYFRAEAIGLNKEIAANLDSYYPRPLFGGGSNGANKNHKRQSRYLQDASYIRLKNLQLGYTLPLNFTKKLSINKCRVFVSGENLWTGTALTKLFDPETIEGGRGGNAYPLSKTWCFGISVTL